VTGGPADRSGDRPWLGQDDWQVRFGWGSASIEPLLADVVVVVDVLRFTTAVDAGVSSGASIFPYRWNDESATAFADDVGAILAGGGDQTGPSLSPSSLQHLTAGTAVVLPSPNGSTCAVRAHELGADVVAGCLRNAASIAAWIQAREPASITVVACGERWPDGSLRPALEDHLGAGAILAALGEARSMSMSMSPEAVAAAALWTATSDAGAVADSVARCASGRQLAQRGRHDDVAFATDLASSAAVPLLVAGCFVDGRFPSAPD